MNNDLNQKDIVRARISLSVI